MRVVTGSFVLLVVLLLSPASFSQLPSSRCDSSKSALEDCTALTQFEPVQDQVFASKTSLPDRSAMVAESLGQQRMVNHLPKEPRLLLCPPGGKAFIGAEL
jgi:hypothetical protein